MRHLVILLLGSMLAVGPAVAGIFGLSEADEVELGRQAAARVESRTPLVADPFVQNYINALGQKLARYSGRTNLRYRFRAIDSREINAFALPGGFIYINRGILEAAGDEDELAGVIGHEIAHVAARHHVDQLKRAQLTGLGLAGLGALLGASKGAAFGKLAAELAAGGALMKFSRDAEREADLLGARIMHSAGYDPRGMITFFEKLERMRRGQPHLLEKFFSSHPSPSERRSNLSRVVAAMPPRYDRGDSSPEFFQAKARLSSRGQLEYTPRRRRF